LPPGPRLDGRRLGIPRNFYFEQLDPDVEAAVREALQEFQRLGAALVQVDVPDIEEFNAVARLVLLAEASSVHARRLLERREDFGEDVRMLFDQGRFVLATEYLDAQRRRREIVQDFRRLLEKVDALVAPAIPIPAPKIGQKTVMLGGREVDVRLATTRFARALNLTGLPLLAVPCGFSSAGMPIGMQLIGDLFDEAGLLEIGHAYEQATHWHKRRPPLAES
jgi:aspartyl-tRNA(Asn)/glutamyl-tRNA(Gln) amidotransferase subunit A